MGRRAPTPPKVVPGERRPSPLRLAVPAAIAWVVLFGTFYFTRNLQNSGGFDRLTLTLLLPEASVLLSPGDDVRSGWRYLAQRSDLAATAALIAAGAWGLGGLSLRTIGLVGTSGPAASLRSGFTRVATGERDALRGEIERTVVTFGAGLSAWSLITLGLGMCGVMSRSLFAFVLGGALLGEAACRYRERGRGTRFIWSGEPPGRGFLTACAVVAALFVGLACLAAMLPPYDFDVKEYHLGGPKEWYLDGRVHFLPHNVYTSFPFLTEMLSLSAMVVRGDWYRGALAGQLVLAGFLPLTAATVFVTGRRLFGTTAGLLGAVVYVTAPWSYRIAVIAYSEGGLSCYLALAVFAATIVVGRAGEGVRSPRTVFLSGLFGGSAMACKYPGLVQVVLPIGAFLVATSIRRKETLGEESYGGPGGRVLDETPAARRLPGWGRRALTTVVAFSAGVALAVGPWLLKNALETNNPVYPLAYDLFGGRDWNADSNARWKSAHRPPHHDPLSLFADGTSVVASSDWQSLAVFGLAPLALLGARRRAAGALWLFVLALFAAWWGLTHRIDRFWVPMMPVVCVLAGAGAAFAEDLPRRLIPPDLGLALRSLWRLACCGLFAIAIPCNLLMVTSTLTGNPNYLVDLESAATAAETPILGALRRTLPPNAEVLLVGEAAIFDARFPVRYNTVFDRNLFEEWTVVPGVESGRAKSAKPAEDIRREFESRGVTHVAVNWAEVLRYRTTYGYTDYVTPHRFAELRRAGVLGEPVTLLVAPADGLSAEIAAEAEREFPTLFRGSDRERIIVTGEVFPVIPGGARP